MTLVKVLSKGFEQAKRERALEWPKDRKPGPFVSWIKGEFFIFPLTMVILSIRNLCNGETFSDQIGLWLITFPIILVIAFAGHIVWWKRREREWQAVANRKHETNAEQGADALLDNITG